MKIFSYNAMFIIIVLFITVKAIIAQEVEDERGFDYDARSNRGPQHWGEIKGEWSACNNGAMQSPIDMSNQKVDLVKRFGELIRNYKPSNATLFNRGHDITLKWRGDAGFILINGTRYFLRQCHWHSPSEHTINGRRFDMEMHMVHTTAAAVGTGSASNQTTKIAVVGLLYRIGRRPDAFLSRLNTRLMSLATPAGSTSSLGRNLGVIDPRRIRIRGDMQYRYTGSLTVPPCTEGVRWIINQRISTVSRRQVNLLREVVHDFARNNARPVQPLNNRRVHLYRPREEPGLEG